MRFIKIYDTDEFFHFEIIDTAPMSFDRAKLPSWKSAVDNDKEK